MWKIYTFLLVCISFCIISESKLRIKKPGLIYILQWTTRLKEPFSFMEMKRDAFIRRGCHFQNCYITDDIGYFQNVTDFDVILFNIVSLLERKNMILPNSRNDDQIYVFVSTESASNYPVGADFNMFFNWTWTYKLNSDVPYWYVTVWNKQGELIGPAQNISWVRRMNATSQFVINKLHNKRRAAAWFASNCAANNKRHKFVKRLQSAMSPYGLKLDIFGNCGNQVCPRGRMEDCYKLLETNYYFYLAFENSFSDDYITEKFLTAAQHYTVPVLFGGANYSRFMPKGMYLDARELGPAKTARKMSKIIRNRRLYYDFFKFHNHYVFHAPTDNAATDPVCLFCAALNDKKLRDERRAYAHFTQWWNGIQPHEDPLHPIVHFDTTNNNGKRQKTYIGNPNEFSMVTEKSIETDDYQDGPLIHKIFNYFFQR